MLRIMKTKMFFVGSFLALFLSVTIGWTNGAHASKDCWPWTSTVCNGSNGFKSFEMNPKYNWEVNPKYNWEANPKYNFNANPKYNPFAKPCDLGIGKKCP